MGLATPTKTKKAVDTTSDDPFVDDRQLSNSPASTKEDAEAEEKEESSLEELRSRYVGDVDLPEGNVK